MADLATNSVLAFASWGCFIEDTSYPAESVTKTGEIFGPNSEYLGTYGGGSETNITLEDNQVDLI